jgi:hypothetical protein
MLRAPPGVRDAQAAHLAELARRSALPVWEALVWSGDGSSQGGGSAPPEQLAALLLAALKALDSPAHHATLAAMAHRLRRAAVRHKCLTRARLLAALLPVLPRPCPSCPAPIARGG